MLKAIIKWHSDTVLRNTREYQLSKLINQGVKMKTYNVSRIQFFNVASVFRFIGTRLQTAGTMFLTANLTPVEAESINAVFPNAIWD